MSAPTVYTHRKQTNDKKNAREWRINNQMKLIYGKKKKRQPTEKINKIEWFLVCDMCIKHCIQYLVLAMVMNTVFVRKNQMKVLR